MPHSMNDVLWPAPWPATGGLILVLALLLQTRWATRRVCRAGTDPALFAAVFFLVTAAWLAVVHAVAWLAPAMHVTLPVLAVSAVTLGLAGMRSPGLSFSKPPRERWWALVPAGLLCLAALGPPTDGDALHYHLPVPLHWWTHQQIAPMPELLHARLVGLGEVLILWGLSFHSDTVMPVFQAASLVLLARVFMGAGRTEAQKTVGALLVCASPVMLFLVPSQKPQLLPAASVIAAVSLALHPPAGLSINTRHLLIAGCVVLAAACKHSFLLDGAVVFAWLWWRASALSLSRRILLATFGVAYAVLLFPLNLRNFLHYGDPFTPLLERFREAPDAEVMAFAQYLRDYARPDGLLGYAQAVLETVIPTRLSGITFCLGLGAACVALVPSASWKDTAVPALAMAAVTTLLGQFSGRFLLVPYLWLALGASTSAANSGVLVWLRRGLKLQALGVGVIALYAAVQFLPGAVTQASRFRTLSLKSSGYDLAQFVDRETPPGALIVSEHRATALMPRETFCWAPWTVPSQSIVWRATGRLLRESHNVWLLTIEPQGASTLNTLLSPCVVLPPHATTPTFLATRNPFNSNTGPTFGLYSLNLALPGCAEALPPQ